MSQLVFGTCWKAQELGSNASDGMDSLTSQKKAGEELNFLLLHPYIGFLAEGVTQTRGGSHLRDAD